MTQNVGPLRCRKLCSCCIRSWDRPPKMSSWSESTSIVIAGLLVFVFSPFNIWLSYLSKFPSWFRFFCFHIPTYKDTFILLFFFRSNLKPHSWSHEPLYPCCNDSSCSHPVPHDCTVRDEEQSPRCLCGRMFRYLTEGSARLGHIL